MILVVLQGQGSTRTEESRQYQGLVVVLAGGMNRPGYREGSKLRENGATSTSNKANKFSPEIRERADRLVQENRGD